MRILVTVPWPERRGGAEAMLQTILDGAQDSGHELELVFTEDGPWPQDLAAAGFAVEVIKAGRVRELHRLVATILRLSSLMRRRRPDLVLNWASKTQLYGAPAAILAGIPGRIVWWQHSIAQKMWLEQLANLLPARAIACYSGPAAAAQARMRPRRRTIVIPAGAAPQDPALAPAPLRVPEGVPVIGIVGRLQPWKGQDRLLAAVALLRERGHDAHVLIVGGDSYGLSPDYAASLPRAVSALGLEGRVTMTGEVSDARPYIASMDVLVNASEPEPFGIVLAEGMAAGLPVVAVDAGGPTEIVENGRTGILARSGSAPDLAEAIEPLLADAELRVRLGAAGLERFWREYSDSAVQKRFFAAMETLAAELPPR